MSVRKTVFKILSFIAPKLTANYAFTFLSNPKTSKIRPYEIEMLKTAEKSNVTFNNKTLATYVWKNGPRNMLLVHGWEGQAGNFSDIIEKLIQNDYTVIAFDAPSHGFSSKGATSFFEYSEAVTFMIKKYDVSLLISHSFGGVATMFSLYNNRDIKIKKYCLLTTPDTFEERINDICELIGISSKSKKHLIEKIEKQYNLKIDGLSVSVCAPYTNVDKSLIVSDKNDKVIPINRSRNVAKNWPVCKFVEVENTGHFRILRDQNIISMVTDFMAK